MAGNPDADEAQAYGAFANGGVADRLSHCQGSVLVSPMVRACQKDNFKLLSDSLTVGIDDRPYPSMAVAGVNALWLLVGKLRYDRDQL